ncbi:hypothetical protein [Alkaliphilus peptidifermentans]|uniref:Uncharacterized protein n=1 Tax=Alkaliphilus peptidifermentans DSM 18978 TaxID=1120976 RepID=A0A1G5K9Z8_9FIRM|nr:hypothetical protein [Alkaliphilus peptidifermentans]SCY97357.1 hypothetical protein SAMN03080606_03348 [Alkaliphilus peptidifermentans DSM 18978]
MREYQLFLSINTENFIPKEDSVRLLEEILDQLDYSDYIIQLVTILADGARFPTKIFL